MELTPSDIRTRRFEPLKKGGIDPDQVYEFLGSIAASFADQQRAITESRARLERVERELNEFRGAETQLENAVLNASRTREETLAKARDEAEIIVGTARREALQLLESTRLDAEELVGAAREEHDRLARRVVHLKAIVKRTEDVLRAMANGATEEVGALGRTRESMLREMLNDPDAVLVLDEQPKVVMPVGGRMPRGIEMGEAVDMLLAQLAEAVVPA